MIDWSPIRVHGIAYQDELDITGDPPEVYKVFYDGKFIDLKLIFKSDERINYCGLTDDGRRRLDLMVRRWKRSDEISHTIVPKEHR